MNWVTAVVAVLGAILGAGGVGVAVVSALARRPVTRVEVADRLNEVALELAEQLKADTEDARRDAREARLEMSAVRREAEALARDLRSLRAAIMDPFVTLERLRSMVGGDPGGNGVTSERTTV